MSKIHFELSVEVGAEGDASGLISSSISSSGGSFAVGGGSRPKSSPFALRMKTGCQPYEYAILYGALKDPRDTVLARSSGSLQPFQRVHIPASLHVRGVLAYIALPAVPSELLVRTPARPPLPKSSLVLRANPRKLAKAKQKILTKARIQ